MKKLLLTLSVVGLSVATMYGQARVFFNNQTFVTSDALTVGPLNMGALGGLQGSGLGADHYSVQLMFAPGSFATQAAFDAAAPTASAIFFGAAAGWFTPTTAGTPDTTFSGFFDAGTVSLGAAAPAGTYTMQVRAWYSGVTAGQTDWATAVASGNVNVGRSAIFTMSANLSPSPANTTPLPGFTVGVVPEPTTFALAGLGIASLLIFRRKK